jgi:hypothetical protein
MLLSTIVTVSLGFLAASCAAVVGTRLYMGRQLAGRNRGLFRFHDGKQIREVDPMAVLTSLEEHPKFRMDLDPKRAIEDGDQEALDCMADAVRIAFGVPAFTSPKRPGLTVYECVELLAVFMLYVDSQKKNSAPRPTSPPSTESTSPSSEKPTTPSTSGCG